MLPFNFPVRKFLQLPVQVHVGFLTRPVTADKSHHDARHSEEQDDEDSGLHMISVPCILPSMRLIAMAVMNRPAMIQTMSI